MHAEEKGQMSDLPQCLVTTPSFQDSLSTESVLALCPLLITKGSCQRQTWNFMMPQPTPAKRGLEHIPLTHRYNPSNEDFTVPGNAGTVCIECFFDFFKGNLKKKVTWGVQGIKGDLKQRTWLYPVWILCNQSQVNETTSKFISKTWLRQQKALNIFQLLGRPG